MAFDEIPVLDLSLTSDPATKDTFLASLREALLDVGFLYVKNTGISGSLVQDVVQQARQFFDLPAQKKEEVRMWNVKSFLGYNTLGNEITASAIDWREQLDLSTPHPLPSAHAPLYHNLLAPNQWPDPTCLPDFRAVYEQYIAEMSTLSRRFTSLIAEALLLPPDAFDKFFDADQQHKLKIVKYPDRSALPGHSEDSKSGQHRQGVGPHKDSMLTSYLLQVPPHDCLQAQNLRGEWVPCPPVPGTLVVAIGQGLEAITHGVCKSTIHQVLSPLAGEGARLSIPFFQGVSYDATFEHVDVPPEILRMRRDRDEARSDRKRGDDVEFTFEKGRWGHLGEATLTNRVKSHPDVGERWYPEILQRIRQEQAQQDKSSMNAPANAKANSVQGVAVPEIPANA